MAILCLASDLNDLRRRIDNILLGYRFDGTPLLVKELGIGGAITVLLKDALNPNLVQTTEHTPAFVHGGPFANIAHGCNTVLATRMALSYGEYVITEAGFGADLGAEKFFNIKCRKSGLKPCLTILVATAQGLKMHGGVALEDISKPNLEGLKRGFDNLDKHIENMQSFGQTVLVAFNRYATDTDEEIALLTEHCHQKGLKCIVNNAFTQGGEGAIELANAVVDTIREIPSAPLHLTYTDNDPIQQKIEKVAKQLYGAGTVIFSQKAQKMLRHIEEMNISHYPVCIAKTQYSFSADAKAYGTVKDFEFEIKDLVINNGAEFIVAIAGNIMRMPGLPKIPQANSIDIIDNKIVGLS